MGRTKIVITIDEQPLAEIDRLVGEGVFPSRSKAIESAVLHRIAKPHRSRLARECAKLNRSEEQALAAEHSLRESESPDY